MIPFTESLRYEYPLTPESRVIDAGGYEGNFALRIHERYGCFVDVFEPIKTFRAHIIERTKAFPKIRVHPYALGASTRQEIFQVKGDMSGKLTDSSEKELVEVVSIAEVRRWATFIFGPIALLKLNIEGMEYEVLEKMLDVGLPLPEAIQCQFHANVPDFENRYARIATRLAATHHLIWREPFCWESWERNK